MTGIARVVFKGLSVVLSGPPEERLADFRNRQTFLASSQFESNRGLAPDG